MLCQKLLSLLYKFIKHGWFLNNWWEGTAIFCVEIGCHQYSTYLTKKPPYAEWLDVLVSNLLPSICATTNFRTHICVVRGSVDIDFA